MDSLKNLLTNLLNGPVDRAFKDAAPFIEPIETRFREIIREEVARFDGAKLMLIDGGVQLILAPVAPPGIPNDGPA